MLNDYWLEENGFDIKGYTIRMTEKMNQSIRNVYNTSPRHTLNLHATAKKYTEDETKYTKTIKQSMKPMRIKDKKLNTDTLNKDEYKIMIARKKREERLKNEFTIKFKNGTFTSDEVEKKNPDNTLLNTHNGIMTKWKDAQNVMKGNIMCGTMFTKDDLMNAMLHAADYMKLNGKISDCALRAVASDQVKTANTINKLLRISAKTESKLNMINTCNEGKLDKIEKKVPIKFSNQKVYDFWKCKAGEWKLVSDIKESLKLKNKILSNIKSEQAYEFTANTSKQPNPKLIIHKKAKPSFEKEFNSLHMRKEDIVMHKKIIKIQRNSRRQKTRDIDYSLSIVSCPTKQMKHTSTMQSFHIAKINESLSKKTFPMISSHSRTRTNPWTRNVTGESVKTMK